MLIVNAKVDAKKTTLFQVGKKCSSLFLLSYNLKNIKRPNYNFRIIVRFLVWCHYFSLVYFLSKYIARRYDTFFLSIYKIRNTAKNITTAQTKNGKPSISAKAPAIDDPTTTPKEKKA